MRNGKIKWESNAEGKQNISVQAYSLRSKGCINNRVVAQSVREYSTVKRFPGKWS